MEEATDITDTQVIETAHLSKPRKTAADWTRDMLMSEDVNEATVGVRTPRVTGNLLLATSSKLLGINRGEQEPDAKDSLQFQRVYGPADYFAEHVLKDANSVGRDLLWKATNKTGLDFMPTGALNDHVDAVFNSSKLANLVDASSPLELADSTAAITRIGEGGIPNADAAPDSMRLVDPSFFGYIDGVRSVDCYATGTELYTDQGWVRVEDMVDDTLFACLVDGKLEYHKAEYITRVAFRGRMCGYDDGNIKYLVTPNHRMYARDPYKYESEYTIKRADKLHNNDAIVMIELDPSDRYIEVQPEYPLIGWSYYKEQYNDMVYCPKVPGGLVYCRRNGGTGFWCGNSFRVGLDAFLTKNVQKGSDGKLYQTFINSRTGQPELVDSVTASRSVIAAPEMMNAKTRSVYALGGKTGVRVVSKEDIDYYLPAGDEMYSAGSNMVPILNACKEMRLHMGAKYSNQAVSLDHREAPLVRAIDSATGKDMTTLAGRYLGSQRARKPGRVVSVTDDAIKIAYDDGTRETVDVYRNYPMNSKGFIDSKPIVKPGDIVDTGSVLTSSNYTNDKGEAAIGTNLRTGWITWKGATYEDAIAISESAAKKLSSTTMYKTSMDLNKTIKLGKKNYVSWKPTGFTDDQLEKLDDDGIVKPGTILMPGDPMVLCVQASEPSPGTFGKRILTDKSQTWEHDSPGVVTDVFRTRTGLRVYTKMSAPAELGDKLSNSFGAKGVIAKIIPDDEMPHGEDGEPLDILFSPLSLLTRTNPSMLHEALLGKVAKHTGRPEILPQFYEGDLSGYVMDRLQSNGLSHTSTITAGKNGREIPGVITGVSHIFKLKHLGESKMDARGTGDYTAEEQAGSSSKRYGSLETQALVGHGVWDVIEDAKLVRGQSNSKFWRDVRTGDIPVMPGEPKIHKKFFAHLQGAGVNVRRNEKGISIFALANADIDELAGPRELKSKDTYKPKTFEPIDGGLFGQDLFGINGDKWAYIQLDEPLPNPVMERPLMQLLNMKEKDFSAVVSGTAEIDGMKSASDIKERLSKINLKDESRKARKELEGASKSKKDAALKKYVAIERMKRLGKSPDQYMLDKIPVLPPEYRPITSFNGLNMVADSNYLYAQLLDARDDLRAAKDLPDEYKQEARAGIYRKWKELVGLYDPEDRKLQSKNVKGLLGWAIGSGGRSPKQSALHRKVLGATVDTVGRGVIIPDSRLKLNEAGIPEKMAFDIFAPMLERSLVKSGYKTIDAMKMVKSRDPRAKDALVKLMDEYPVQLNRAPTLHKLGLMGLKPVLVKGHALRINPSICPAYAADYDGDTVLNSTTIVIDACTLNARIGDSQLSDLCEADSVAYQAIKEHDMLAENTKTRMVHFTGFLEDLPRLEETKVVSGNKTEWDVPEGYYADTIDPETGEKVLAPITKVSKHENLKMFDCTLSNSGYYPHVVTASEDHSLITLDSATGKLVKTRPEDALGKCVPYLKSAQQNEQEHCVKYINIGRSVYASYELGVFLGIMIGDGWVDANNVIRIACCEETLQQYIEALLTTESSPVPITKNAKLFSYKADKGRFSKNNQERFTVYADTDIATGLKRAIGSSAGNKRIPAQCLHASKAHMIGVLIGLLATDGAVSYSTKQKEKGNRHKATKVIAIHTTSPELRDGIQDLCRRLGVRSSATPYKGKHSLMTCYMICLSIEDIVVLCNKNSKYMVIPVAHKQKALELICNDMNTTKDNKSARSLDVVPFPDVLTGAFSYSGTLLKYRVATSRARENGFITRHIARQICDVLRQAYWPDYTEPKQIKKEARFGHTPEEAKALVDWWIALVEDDTVGWEVVTDVQPSTSTAGWDCTVPGPYTFTLSTGTVVQDTMNVHVPVTSKAKEDTIKHMMPERNLIAMRDRKIAYKPEKEYIQGLHLATRMKTDGKAPVWFDSINEARDAYRRGEIAIDDPIRIRE